MSWAEASRLEAPEAGAVRVSGGWPLLGLLDWNTRTAPLGFTAVATADVSSSPAHRLLLGLVSYLWPSLIT